MGFKSLCGNAFETVLNWGSTPVMKIIKTQSKCPKCGHEYTINTPVEQTGTNLDFNKPPGGGLSELCPWKEEEKRWSTQK